MSYPRSEFPADLLDREPSVQRPAQRKRSSLTRVLFTFCVGVGATLAWQSYGNAARKVIANSYPQLGWLAPETAVAKTALDTPVPATSSPDPQELKAISLGLAALRQRVDQLAIGQEQMTRDFSTKLQAAQREILDKIAVPPPPQPVAAPARKPVPPPTQVAPLR